MKYFFVLLILFSSAFASAHQCSQHLKASLQNPISKKEIHQILLSFGILNPNLPERLPQDFHFQQVDHISIVFMGFQMATKIYESKKYNAVFAKLMLEAQVNMVTNYLAYKSMQRKPIPAQVRIHLENLSKVHVEISRRTRLAEDSKSPSFRQLNRAQADQLQYIISSIPTLEASNTYLRLD